MIGTTLIFLISLIPPDAKVNTWPLEGLNGELNNIAYMESYYGVYVAHEPHARGPFHTAFGSLGLKPSTAYTQYEASPRLQARFPNLHDQRVFLNEFWHNKQLYTDCANFHWWYLRHTTPSLARAVFAWRWGLTASNEASDEQITADTYTTRYSELTQKWLNTRTFSRR